MQSSLSVLPPPNWKELTPTLLQSRATDADAAVARPVRPSSHAPVRQRSSSPPTTTSSSPSAARFFLPSGRDIFLASSGVLLPPIWRRAFFLPSGDALLPPVRRCLLPPLRRRSSSSPQLSSSGPPASSPISLFKLRALLPPSASELQELLNATSSSTPTKILLVSDIAGRGSAARRA
ncbi:hypothetical protein PR202_ga17771 [Eleusine coracana subsp. coracana]|uniref:Uncharacterized protein n=1 Tax=Eleusine coracana subsp. coracana TaxID=191504 RepID=A0AAV5CQ89_ELECO|nr:hypothetical protein PR202_ga17524 [Eleusine coracana subsp. coracana]GJN00579.1 hypothetical protein PR202_ga17771 [Eleusine coracana subsp. coracana]